MTTRLGRSLAPALLALGLATGTSALAQEEDSATQPEPQRCISAPRIDRAEVIDDRTIVFHMRGRAMYLNVLPNRCPGLRVNDTIAYRPRTHQLCSVDTITIVMHAGGPSRGPTCGLGTFTAITEDELKALKNPVPEEDESEEDS